MGEGVVDFNSAVLDFLWALARAGKLAATQAVVGDWYSDVLHYLFFALFVLCTTGERPWYSGRYIPIEWRRWRASC